ncbi:MAG: type II secretion system F family protein [Coriobacteriales bacterium]|nr:type II secretion system F family protein [Coriobacteriales bacterium]
MTGAMQVACLLVLGICACGCAYGCLCGGLSDLVRLVSRAGNGLAAALGDLRLKGERRDSKRVRAEVMRDMPLFLDIVTLGVSAGLSFDSSLDLYCDRYQTPLADLMSQAMLSWRLGTCGRAQALEDLARRTNTPVLMRFASTVSEALAFGTPLADALSRQAQVIRDEQRAQVEEEIERVPVKMLIPLGTLIVPAMLLAILGPLLGPALQMA